MNRLSVVATLAVIAGLLLVAGASMATTAGTPLHEASLRNGDYGGGAAIDTMDGDYGHGGSPHVLGSSTSSQMKGMMVSSPGPASATSCRSSKGSMGL